MPQYNLNALGASEFERLSQALIKKVIGLGSVTFGAGRDGAREATFTGTSSTYPSPNSPWKGDWIFQVKFHDLSLTTPEKARTSVLSEVDKELDKIFNKYKHPCDNFIMITNVPISAVAESGTIDTAQRLVKTKYKKLKNFAFWGADEVCRFLDAFPSARQPYLHLLVTGDLIAQLLDERRARLDELATTIKTYLRTSYTREMHAQLDQAGDVSENPVRLQDVFFDLYAEVDDERGAAHLSRNHQVRNTLRRYQSSQRSTGTLGARLGSLLLSEGVNRLVIVGGPGEGKSTVGQYVAQVHRSMLLGHVTDVALHRGQEIDETYLPLTPRIPFRIILKDFGQWLAEKKDRGQLNAGTIDEFVSSQISTVTSRRVTPDDLHQILRTNPALLILDGLDEVTDPDLRKILLSRVGEFVDRCDTLDANLQILASTRPTGYTKEFDPAVFLHMRLAKLEPVQVKSYVSRWAKAKSLDESKSSRVRQTMDECLQDEQIRLLTNTPLQVTILLLIISSGGTPPRQREALFNEYLDIMYRREMAKGRNIIQSEKELLLGLHKYVGYILHEKTTRAEAMASVLPRPDYEKHVLQFLTWHDPFSPQSKRNAELKAITTEAGERLVLIVEPEADVFGFELRSIQEFFAACHLADTSSDTAQRYNRFEAIARLPHWRNVALFFVGRVGRNYAGEAANIIEVCRDIDRDVPDVFVHRGGTLALELAADRAFGPNRRRQNALLELGVEVFERHVSEGRRQQIQDLLVRLPVEDQKDLAIPLLEKKITLLNSAYLGPLLRTLHRLDTRNRHVILGIERMAESTDHTEEALSLYFDLRASAEQVTETVQRIAFDLGPEVVGRVLSRLRLHTIWRACDDLKYAGVTEDFISQALLEAAKRGSFSWVRTEERDFLIEAIQRPWPSGCASVILHSTALLQINSLLRSTGTAGTTFSEDQIFVPDYVMVGNITLLGSENSPFDRELATAVLWLLHMLVGDVTPASANAAVEFFRSLPREFCSFASIFGGVSFEVSPAIDLIYAAIEKGGDWEVAERALVTWGGKTGAVRWRRLCNVLVKRLLDTPAVERPQSSDNFIQNLQGDASPDQMILDTPKELHPALTDYAWSLALRNRADRYAVDSTVFEQAIRHLLDSHSSPFVLRDLAIRLYTDIPHWMGRTELDALKLGMLTTLLDSPYAAGNVEVIPIAVRSCLEFGDIPDSVLRAACAAVGRSDEMRRSNIIRIPGPHSSALYKELLEIVFSVADPEVREGALVMIKDNSYMHSYHSSISGGSGTRIRVKGFARMHRALAKSKVPMERNAGLCLFAVRAPRTHEDWSILYDAILSCRDQQTATSIRIALGVNANSEDGRDLSEWISFMERCLQHVEYPPLQALITDRLDELLASQDQSLHHYEEEFGLPLSWMTS
ncbi:hypothetical protein JL475_03805 [Streptomyces sp. M2CJ-2]|uniref:NACHT domain-containing protein n=1 Tax=Streptomyces sp. M2CJ-2 TaxID=2803948 RepID=UPI001921CE2C|nr:hypothetical protein [Streptomyces sp. M2CJ-2]MBL3665155.1 hypothetical protein [Streptomyces sp. M2CJ-2]